MLQEHILSPRWGFYLRFSILVVFFLNMMFPSNMLFPLEKLFSTYNALAAIVCIVQDQPWNFSKYYLI